MKDSQRTKYAEMINVIANTCLLFCDRKSMSSHIDYDMEANNASSMKEFRQRSTFCELSNEVSRWYDGDVDLSTLLVDYQEASGIFSDFKRSYSIDLHNADVAEAKRQQIFNVINFLNPVVDTDSDISFLNEEKKSILYKIKEEKTTQCLAVFILLMVGLIPSYSSKKGAASHIIDDFHLLMDFLRKYGEQAPTTNLAKSSPILSGFETWVRKNEESEIRRIDLINMTRIYLETTFGYSSALSTFLFNRQIDRIYPNLEGFWSDNEIPGSHFWKFEQIANGYHLYEYNLKNRILESTKYECYIYGKSTDDASFYVCHPSMMRKIVEHDNIDLFQEWVDGDVTKNKNGTIIKLSFHPTIRMSTPILPKALYRVENTDFYDKTLDDNKLSKINLFNEDGYSLFHNCYAITIDYLYVILDDKDISRLNVNKKSSTLYLKIPKSLDPSLELLTLDDEWGICNFHNGDSYFLVVNSMLYFKINTEEERKQFGIEVVDQIG